ncbi:MAG TPA: hypothetical protein VJB94_02620 [Candidatus Nanoarchaeia archaeon]|nr:hypothetical protein [Candidatus Nanoarchaeia archaeon]
MAEMDLNKQRILEDILPKLEKEDLNKWRKDFGDDNYSIEIEGLTIKLVHSDILRHYLFFDYLNDPSQYSMSIHSSDGGYLNFRDNERIMKLNKRITDNLRKKPLEEQKKKDEELIRRLKKNT